MGQKVNPICLRLGYIQNWRSLWYADKTEYQKYVVEDYKIREYIKKKFAQASVAKVIIERLANKIKVIIHTARPGVIIGRRGADIDRLRTALAKISNKEIGIETREIKNPSLNAQLVAQNVAFQLIKRVAFRRAMKRAIDQSLQAGAKGIKIQCAGRLNGVEMARTESYLEGKLPLQTYRANIDYGFAESLTTYGILGIKVWINLGEVIGGINLQETADEKPTRKPMSKGAPKSTYNKGA